MGRDESNYIVTGATGWLGRRVVRALTSGNTEMGVASGRGNRLRVLVAPGEDTGDLAELGVDILIGDIRESNTTNQLVRGFEGATLLHLAGVIHPKHGTKEFTEVNVNGTRNLIDAAGAAGLHRAVVMSSNSPIGASRSPFEVFDEASAYNPYMGYGRSKQAMEELLRARFVTNKPPKLTIIRAPWFYGPDQPKRQTRFFTMVKEGRFPLMGRGENRRSMAYVDSLAYGILLAAGNDSAAGGIYWLADERPYPMHEVVSTVQTVMRDDFGIKAASSTLHVPGVISDLARVADWSLQQAGLYNQEIHVLSEMNLTISCSIDKAKRELGYRPLVDLREGMRRSIAWCLERGVEI